MNDRAILDFVFEIGLLRRIKHEGWRVAGIEHPESVADHVLRAAQLGFLLAKLEGYPNPYEIVTHIVFHDIGEARIGDIHKIANRYIKADEEQAVKDQVSKLGETGDEILKMWQSVELHNDPAGKIAKDADQLEQAITAKEHMERGYTVAKEWIDAVELMLKTDSARRLIKTLRTVNSNDWWQGLKKM